MPAPRAISHRLLAVGAVRGSVRYNDDDGTRNDIGACGGPHGVDVEAVRDIIMLCKHSTSETFLTRSSPP